MSVVVDRAPAAALSVQAVTDAAGFLGLREAWDALLGRSRASSIFVSWEWAYSWWETFGRGGALRLLVARGPDGGVVGIVPLARWRRRIGLRPHRVLAFLGGHSVASEYLDLVAAAGREGEVADAVLDYLARCHDWDLLEWFRVRADSSTLVAIEARVAGGLLHRSPVRVEPALYVPLPATWEAYLSGMRHHDRYNVRSRRRRVEGERDVQVDVAREPANGVMEEVERLHQARMTSLGRPGSFASRRFAAFHRRVAARLAARGWLRVYRLGINGQTVAVRYGFAYRGVFYDYSTGFEPAYQKLHVGFVLLGHSIERAIGEGLREFDFLGPGEYKDRWQTETRDKLSFVVSRRPEPVRAYHRSVEWRARIMAAVRWVTPATLLPRLRGIRQKALVRLGRPLR